MQTQPNKRRLNTPALQLQLHARALELLKAGDFAAAQAPLSRLLLTLDPADPQRARCLATLALVFAETGRGGAAQEAARQALRADPDLDVARHFLQAG